MSGETVKHVGTGESEAAKTEVLLNCPQIVLHEMVRLTLKGDRIWFGKLEENMIGKNSSQGTLTGLLIARTLEYLKENGILERYTGETKKGYAGFLWRLKDAELEEVKAGYIKYLETIGAHKPTISERNTLRMERRRAEFSDSRYLIDSLKRASREGKKQHKVF